MWSLLTSRAGLAILMLVFVLGTGAGWATHGYATQVASGVQSWWTGRQTIKANEQEAENAARIEEEAALISAEVIDTTGDAPVSDRLDCLFRSSAAGVVPKCMPNTVLKPAKTLPPAKAQADRERRRQP